MLRRRILSLVLIHDLLSALISSFQHLCACGVLRPWVVRLGRQGREANGPTRIRGTLAFIRNLSNRDDLPIRAHARAPFAA